MKRLLYKMDRILYVLDSGASYILWAAFMLFMVGIIFGPYGAMIASIW